MAKNNKKKKLRKKKQVQNITTTSILKNWWEQKHPVLLFGLAFLGLMIVFYAIIYAGFFRNHIHPYLLGINSGIASFILNLFGQQTQSMGSVISSNAFSIDIKQGCDALEPMALFAAIALAYPAVIIKKIQGVFIAILILFSLNIVRIVSLFLIGVYIENIFDLMHIDVWQFLFMMVAILLCLWFIRWTKQSNLQTPAKTVNHA